MTITGNMVFILVGSVLLLAGGVWLLVRTRRGTVSAWTRRRMSRGRLYVVAGLCVLFGLLGVAQGAITVVSSRSEQVRCEVVSAPYRHTNRGGSGYWVVDSTCGQVQWNHLSAPSLLAGHTYELQLVVSRGLFAANDPELVGYSG